MSRRLAWWDWTPWFSCGGAVIVLGEGPSGASLSKVESRAGALCDLVGREVRVDRQNVQWLTEFWLGIGMGAGLGNGLGIIPGRCYRLRIPVENPG